MPIHDWKKPPVGLYHHFHQQWTGELCDGLNAGALPAGFFALIDQRALGMAPDVLALSLGGSPPAGSLPDARVATAAPPQVRFVSRDTGSDDDVYARRANRVSVRNSFGELVAMIEIVSPGNKHSKASMRAFVEKTTEFLTGGVHLLVIDLFPPTRRDPQGIHKVIWDHFHDDEFELPADKPLTFASYEAGDCKTAYVEPAAVGDRLPGMPLFLEPNLYVPAPLEETYMRTWEKCPGPFKDAVAGRNADGPDPLTP